MEFKQLAGYGLTIAGLAITPLFFIFLTDSQYISWLFLSCLAFAAVAFFLLGVFILNKH